MQTVDDLILQNLSLADNLARKNKRRNIYFEDLQSVAREFLVDAANQFNPQKGASFKTYAYSKITWGIKDYIGWLDRCCCLTDLQIELGIKIVMDHRDDLLHEILNCLPKHIKPLFVLRYKDEMTNEQIAQKTGMTVLSVKQLLWYYRKIVRNKLKNMVVSSGNEYFHVPKIY